MITLHSWQQPLYQRQVDILSNHGVVLNACGTGVGKTYLTVQHLVDLAPAPVFIICPKTVISNWRRVLDAFEVPQSRVQGVINWEKLMTGKTQFWDGKGWGLEVGTIVVVDEVHKGASGPKTITSKMLALLKAYGFKVIMLSATIADSPLKMRACGYHLGLHDYNPASFFKFCRAYGCYPSPFHQGLDFPKGPTGKKHMARLHEAMKDKMVRCALADIPGFPECVIEAKLYDLKDEYTDEVNKIYSEMEKKLRDTNTNPMIEKLRARQRTELFKVPLLCDLAEDALEEDKSVVLFVCFRETLFQLVAELTKRGHKVSSIYGQQDVEERDKNVYLFQENVNHVCVATIDAGGTGLSLHNVKKERDRIAYLCPHYNSTLFRQALGRIHRDGGTAVYQEVVLIARSIEERVKRALDSKLHNLDAINGISDGDLEL